MRRLLLSVLSSAFTARWLLVLACLGAGAQAQSVDAFNITGMVQSDSAGTGLPEGDHQPMAGVIIRLHSDPNGDGNPADGTVVQTTATDSDGYYVLMDVEPGFYVVEQIDPPGATSTFDGTGDPNDSRAAVEVIDEDVEGIDFLDTGVTLLGVSGQVLLDGPLQDGLFGEDDLPITGVVVHLYADLNQDGQIDAADVRVNSAITRRNGRFGFGGLVAGHYVVLEVDPAGATSINDRQGAADDNQVDVQLIAADMTQADFLDTDLTLHTLSGSVRLDLDGDGDPTDNDPPLAGVTLLLFTDPDGDGLPFDGDPIDYTATDLAGRYAFTNLPPGSYAIFEFDPQGASSTYDAVGSLTDNLVGATILDGDVTGLDFLDAGALTGIASGITWVDGPNQDALFTPDDVPAAGISIALYADLDGDGVLSLDDVFMGYTGSVSGGSFAFPPVVYGPYLAIQATPPGAVAVNDTAGLLTDATIGFTQSGSFFQNLYFLNQGLTLAAISGQVRHDGDGNGDPTDPDPAIPNVRVRLFTDPDGDGNASDGALLGLSVTNGQGRFQFVGLAPGAYVVEAEPVQGATATFDPVAPVTDSQIALQLAGSDLTGLDFLTTGALLANLSGTVFHEGPANDGAFSADDIPLPGVTIQLYSDVNEDQQLDINDLLISTVVTDLTGAYAFTGLPAGLYLIFESDPPGATSVLDAQGHPTDNTIAITLAGTDVDELNFLDTGVTFSTLSGRVLDDTDENGVADPYDRPLPGVTVSLYVDLYSDGERTVDDVFLATAVTDSTGTFTFPDLPGGSYLVEQTDPRGATSTGDSDGTNDNLVGIQLTFEDDSSATFLDAFDPTGYFYDAVTGEIITGGTVAVTGPGTVTLWQDGHNGQYVFETDGTPGTYTLTAQPPAGFIAAPMRSAEPKAYDPSGQPDPATIGSAENSSAPGSLVTASAVANPFYLTFTLGADDPLIINNNLPLIRSNAPTFHYWTQSTLGSGGSPTADLDGDLTPDLLEYAFGTNPASGISGSSRHGVVHNSVADTFDAFYTLPEQGLNDIRITVKVLADLANSPSGWSTTSLAPTQVSNGDGTRTVTFPHLESDPAITGSSLGFVRFEVAWDEDLDGNPEAVIATPATGFQRRLLPTEMVTWGASFAAPPLLEGRVDAVDGSTLDLTTSLNGQALQSLLTAGTTYYLEVVSGDDAGHRIEIDASASTGQTLRLLPDAADSTLMSLPSSLVAAHVVIRPHRTLAEWFPTAHYTATNSPATADRVLTYHPPSQAFHSHWLFNKPGGPIWVREGDANLVDQGASVLAPQAGAYVHRRTSPLSLALTGPVRSHPFVFRLAQRHNLLANPWPIAASPALRAMTSANGFISSNGPATADQIAVWKADLSAGFQSFDTYFYLRFGPSEFWVKQGDASLTNFDSTPLFRPGMATFIKSVDGMPTFVAPTPWQP